MEPLTELPTEPTLPAGASLRVLSDSEGRPGERIVIEGPDGRIYVLANVTGEYLPPWSDFRLSRGDDGSLTVSGEADELLHQLKWAS